MYETYEQDHRALDVAFDVLNQAVSARDPLETARATKAFKFHLDLHLDKEDTHMYRIIRERVSIPDQGRAMALMGAHAPQERFPEIVAWMFPLIGDGDRVNITRSWQMGMPPEGFAGAAKLIELASATTGPHSPARSPSSSARVEGGVRAPRARPRRGCRRTSGRWRGRRAGRW